MESRCLRRMWNLMVVENKKNSGQKSEGKAPIWRNKRKLEAHTEYPLQ
jgi:hypothetical protein